MNTRCLRILVYAQHLSGVGHYVRTFEIACELATRHRVFWVEGGRPVPRAPCPELRVVELPRIRRGRDGGIQGLDGSPASDALMRERAARLLRQVAHIRPDVFLVEYFPFSKRELGSELVPAIDAVRARGGKVFCSLRDVVRKTRFERAYDYAGTVCGLLNQHFDAVLVHADPALTRLDEHFPDVGGIDPPIHYTGLVSEKLRPSPGTPERIAEVTAGKPFVLASAGGGAGGRQLITQVAAAWRDPRVAGERLLVICGGLGWPDDPARTLVRKSGGGNTVLLPFRPDFLHWLAVADLSISQCGYNTAANLLETGTPAIVSPNPDMSDQPFRARRMADLGLVELLDPDDTGNGLPDSIRRALARPRTMNTLDLEGASNTRMLIEAGV